MSHFSFYLGFLEAQSQFCVVSYIYPIFKKYDDPDSLPIFCLSTLVLEPYFSCALCCFHRKPSGKVARVWKRDSDKNGPQGDREDRRLGNGTGSLCRRARQILFIPRKGLRGRRHGPPSSRCGTAAPSFFNSDLVAPHPLAPGSWHTGLGLGSP